MTDCVMQAMQNNNEVRYAVRMPAAPPDSDLAARLPWPTCSCQMCRNIQRHVAGIAVAEVPDGGAELEVLDGFEAAVGCGEVVARIAETAAIKSIFGGTDNRDILGLPNGPADNPAAGPLANVVADRIRLLGSEA